MLTNKQWSMRVVQIPEEGYEARDALCLMLVADVPDGRSAQCHVEVDRRLADLNRSTFWEFISFEGRMLEEGIEHLYRSEMCRDERI